MSAQLLNSIKACNFSPTGMVLISCFRIETEIPITKQEPKIGRQSNSNPVGFRRDSFLI